MPRSFFAFLRRYGRDERGVISVMAVGALILALAVSMIVIDTGAMLYARRDLQAATDAAALGAVRQLDNAESAAQMLLDQNGYSAGGAPEVIVGLYTADPLLDPEDRFTEADGTMEPSQLNAVRVFKRWESPTYFARLFGFGEATAIDATATAAYVKTVSFSAGTRLAELNEGLANQILGGLLGTTLNLSLIDYNALASANIDALSFLDALATEVGLEAGSDTYGDVLAANVTLGNLVVAAVEVLNSDSYEGDRANALQALAQLPAAGVSVPLNDLLGAAPFLDRTIGSIRSDAGNDLNFNLLGLISGAAMAAGQGQAVGFGTDVNLGSLASVTGTITVGSPMAHMAVGKVGDTVSTSQVDIQLNTEININIPLVLTTKIALPIFIRAADGTATVSGIPCDYSGTMVVLEGRTNAGTAHFGVGPSGSTPTVSLTLLGFSLLNVPIAGSVPIASSGPTEIGFSESEYDTPKPISSDVSVISDLGDSLEVGGSGNILSGLTNAIAAALGPLDLILTQLLDILGIKLGSMDMVVHGTKCRAPTLVG